MKILEVPAKYETVTEQIEIAPASTKWVRRKGDKNCLSANPDDCMVWCLVEVPTQYETVTKTIMKVPPTTKEVMLPAEYKTLKKTVMITPPTTREITVPAEYLTIKKTVMVKPAETRVIEIPGEYKTIKKRVMTEPAQTRMIEVPAEFKTMSNRRLAKQGGYSEWKEVLCQNKIDNIKIKEIQEALRKRGYNPGPSDDVFGQQTKTALIQFQKDKSLPIGQLDFETLKALGVSY